MSEKYSVISELGDGYCSITPHEHSKTFRYSFNSVDVNDQEWVVFGKVVEACEMWSDELFYVIKRAKGHNWHIDILKPNGTGNGVTFSCYGNDGPSINLGTLAECYDDCEACTICHNWKARQLVAEYEEDEEADGISQYEMCRYHCEGCYAHPCVKINGREDLEKRLQGGE